MTPTLFFFFLGVQALFLFCMAGFVFYACYIFWTFHREVPYVPTSYSVIRRMIASAGITPHDRVVDLGSGTGRIVLEVARRYAVEVVGVEWSPLLCCAARLRQLVTRCRGHVTWVRRDFIHYPLHDVSVVFCFLTTPALTRLVPRFDTLLKGARIVSYKFRIPLPSPWEEQKVSVGRNDWVYVYTRKM